MNFCAAFLFLKILYIRYIKYNDMNHKLALEVPDTLNTKYIKISDFSDYNDNIPVECALLEVTVPGFNSPVQITGEEIEPGFNLLLSACELKLQHNNCDSCKLDLPDGIYILKYSVSPREYVNVEYNYLRVSCLMNRYKKALCCIPLNGTEPDEVTKEKLKELNNIFMYIEAAKSAVEICGNPSKGMEMYEYAKKLLSKFDCITC